MRNSESGAVSIFIVLFTALLVTVVTTGFIQIMLRNQQQATNNDLSQSAYDSAQAGVEDAKRALVRLKECETSTAPSCVSLRNTFLATGAENNCEILDAANIGVNFNPATHEVEVGNGLNQAYTCVKIQVRTTSYEGVLTGNQSDLIPLDNVETEGEPAKVRLWWFTSDDITPEGSTPVLPALGADDLPPAASWSTQNPTLMRTQLIQFPTGNIQLDKFDAPGSPNARSLFLYPFGPWQQEFSFDLDTRRNPANTSSTNNLRKGGCQPNFDNVYACSVILDLADLPSAPNREAYLQLAPLYGIGASGARSTHFKVEMLNGTGSVIDFDGTQPIVDSTGRASDLFRRVRARVSVSVAGVETDYPDAALSLDKSLCKDFYITADAADYRSDTDSFACEASDTN